MLIGARGSPQLSPPRPHQRARISRRYRQHVGKVVHAHFHVAGQQQLALVATESGVIAGLDLRTGGIAWRNLLAVGERVVLLQPHGKMLLSVSVSIAGAFVRLWGTLGGLAWDAHIPRMVSPAAALPPDAIVAGGVVFVCWQSGVRALHFGSGELLWEWDAHEGVRLASLLSPPSVTNVSAASRMVARENGPHLPPVHVFGFSTDDEMIATVLEPAEGGRAVTKASAHTFTAAAGAPSATMIYMLDRECHAFAQTRRSWSRLRG